MSKKKIKVLLLADSNSFHTARFAQALKKQNCRVLPVSLEKGSICFFQLKRIGPINSLHYLLAVFQLRTIINRFRPDIINPHFASGYGFIAALAAHNRKIPIILNLWGSDILIVPDKSFLHKLKTAYALKRASYVIGDSQYLINAADKISPLQQTSLIPWGIEREFFSLHKKNYAFHKPLKVIVPRHQEDVYNNLFIVKALAPLIDEGKIELTFPAFGSRLDYFRKQSQAIVNNKINFYRKLPRQEFLLFMTEHDIYLSASLSDSSPVSLIEAMALGLLPVAAEIDGVKEWLTAESGFTFKQNDEIDLRNLFSRIISDNNSYDEMRRCNYKRVMDRAVFEDNVSKQIEIMNWLIRKNKLEQ